MLLTDKFSSLIPLEERLGLSDGMKVLDVGCGDGDDLNALRGSKTLRVGLELNRERIKRGHALNSRVEFVLADACYMPFRRKGFDVVMSKQFVSHIWNLDMALGEMEKVCSGNVYVHDGSMLNLWPVIRLIVKFGPSWLRKKRCYSIPGVNQVSMLEYIHSIFWWKKKLGNQITVQSRRDFRNPLLNWLWKHFGPDCIFTYSCSET